MMKPRFLDRSKRAVTVLILVFFGVATSLIHAADEPATLISLRQLRNAVAQQPRKLCSFRIEGIVRAANHIDGTLFLQDDSEADLLLLDLGNLKPEPGQRLLLQASNCPVGWTGAGLRIGRMPVLDIDGSHPTVSDSASTYLHAGQNAIRVAWFNDVLGSELELDVKPSGKRRQKVPDSWLNHAVVDPATGRTNYVTGLDYECYEGMWGRLPDFSQLTPVKVGIVTNLNIGVRTRNEHVGLEFTGFLTVPQDGFYAFYLKSDDGGRVYLPEPSPEISVIGSGEFATPKRVSIGEALSPEADFQWSEVEGELSFAGESGGETELELKSGDSRMRLMMANSRGEPPAYLLHSRIMAEGICQGTFNAEGDVLANTMVLSDWTNVHVLEPESSDFWTAFQNVKVSDLALTNSTGTFLIHGRIRKASSEKNPVIEDETGQIAVELLMPPPEIEDEPVQLLGKFDRDGAQLRLRQAVYRKDQVVDLGTNSPKTVLTTAAQVQQLTRAQAGRAFPVKIRGVVTFVTPNYASLVVQDSTRAIFVTHYNGGWQNGVPRVGEYWQIEGISNPADFSPVIELQKATRLGPGRLPDPVRPTRDQLINGSLDAQYVELQGVVTSVNSNRVALLTRIGKIEVTLLDFPQQDLRALENALVRIRGCLFAEWDRNTHRVKINSGIEIGGPNVTVDEPAPGDAFDAVKKSASELLYFDPQASVFQRIRTSGQILHARDNLYYMMDGTNGLRFVPRESVAFEPGDLVEVVGYPQLGEPSPVLQEAVARKIGHSPLPSPGKLPDDNLLQEDRDSTLVRLESLLVDVRRSKAEETLEMQSGLRTFVARLDLRGAEVQLPEVGSRLALTGVYNGLGGNRVEGRGIDSFELLLNSPEDIRILARPPWWTLERLLVLVGILAGVLTFATIWINLLRRQVEKRTNQLQTEIQERERIERHHAIEIERTRIARDIHDELGCNLSEIRLLSEMTLSRNRAPAEIEFNANKISAKALETTRVLDEIVWAVDPKNDTLESLLNYLFTFASDYLSLAGIRFRIDAPTKIPHHALTTQIRHQLYMTVKETLANIVNHANATEVSMRVQFDTGSASIIIEDNGRGFTMDAKSNGDATVSGLNNMRKRFSEIGGEFALDSAPDRGTRVEFKLPLNGQTIS